MLLGYIMYVNDIENDILLWDSQGIEVHTSMLKLFLLLYADDIVIFTNSPYEPREGLNI